MAAQKTVIKVEQFEGPYDVLLELTQQQKLDISTISLTQITDSFLNYVKEGNIPPEQQADFLLVASTLLLLKIKRALPTLEATEEEEINELTDRVRIYQLYREAAHDLQKRWRFGQLLPAGFWGSQARFALPIVFTGYETDTLHQAMESLLADIPVPKHPTAHLIHKSRSLQDSLRLFEQRLQRASRFVFHEAVGSTAPQDIAVSFLAILELARQRVVAIHQTNHFDHIHIEKNTDARRN